MDKRGYKLQEFVAHSANVNCLKIGRKTHRNFITGGDDEKVNLWSIGKPTATTSLGGHTSPIESVAFDKLEVLVAAGASSGVIKLWDLEETKVVRTLNGHRSYCTALEFHPFGEFFASGSMDTNLKIWDIRKKGCIHTYKGHRRAVSTIRFSPDGRWVVSGGLDNVVKIWDLTAGKLLHEFKFHQGHIRSMDFHPLEFLLATGSSDRTVKFWDLETFELIGSTRPEATGVRSVTFHPDGRTLFCGSDISLKAYSWEPVICHDALDMGWSTLGDLCMDDGKLLGCSYYQNSVAVWVADTTLIEPHGCNILAEEKTGVNPKFNLQQDLTERIGSPKRSIISPDDDTKDIKNIYVDSVTPVVSRKSPTVMNLPNPKEIDNLNTRKQIPADKILINNSAKEFTKLVINDKDNTTVSLKPSHRRRPSTTKLDIDQMSLTVESELNNGPDTNQKTFLPNEKAPSVANEFQKASSPGDKSVDSNKELKSVKYVNGVVVVHGRTRSLVERFEKREKLTADGSQSQTPDLPTQTLTNTDTPPTRVKPSFQTLPCAIPVKTLDVMASEEPVIKTLDIPEKPADTGPTMVQKPEAITLDIPEKRAETVSNEAKTKSSLMVQKPDSTPEMVVQRPRTAPEKGKGSPVQKSRRVITERVRPSSMLVTRRSNASPARLTPERTKTSPVVGPRHDTPSQMTRLTSKKDDDVADHLMLNHDVFVSSLRSRLTKLQVVRHFFVQKDMRGAINALRKLQDHAVQADVASVVMEKMDSLTLVIFSELLPVLLDLLDSKTERHINVSLELLVKLVAVFGPVVSSTISAPPTVGVDLHAEKRLECCNECHKQLQKINKCLPPIIRRGGLPARCGQELNIILQKL